MGKEISKKHEKAINEFVKECKKKFGENLISVVLFGSVARETATRDLKELVTKGILKTVGSGKRGLKYILTQKMSQKMTQKGDEK